MSASPSQERDRAQTLRLRRYYMGLSASVAVALLAGLETALGLLPPTRLLVFVLLLGAVVLTFYLLIVSGINLRFRDPSMTFAQIFWAMIPTLYAMYYARMGRAPFLMMAAVAFLFGVFRLDRRQFLLLTAAYLAGYGVVLALATRFQDLGGMRLKAGLAQLIAQGTVLVEIGLIGAYMGDLRQTLRMRNHELQQALDRIHELAVHDELTGVRNRRFLMGAFEHEARRSARTGSPLSVLMLDLDHFKAVNDEHGHNAGDEVLRQFAALVDGLRRDVDFFGRYGGEEFLLILPDTPLDAARDMAMRLRERVAAERFAGLPHACLTVSGGLAEYASGEAVGEIMERVDRALYRAKAAGRNRIEVSPGRTGHEGAVTAGCPES